MHSEFYEKIMRPFRTHPQYVSVLNLFNRFLTLAGFLLYPVLLGWTAVLEDKRFFAFLFVPAFFFLAMSRIRKILNSPRPYEVYDMEPLIARDGGGQSFPSRHVFSIFLIGTLWCGVLLPVGILLLLCGVLLALIRVVAGVHFPKDVLWGAALGLLCGAAALFICTL